MHKNPFYLSNMLPQSAKRPLLVLDTLWGLGQALHLEPLRRLEEGGQLVLPRGPSITLYIYNINYREKHRKWRI